MTRHFKLLLFIAMPFATFAQNAISVEEASRPYSAGSFSSFQVEIPKADLKTIDKNWQKYISAGTKSKVENNKGEYLLRGAINPNISPNPFNIVSQTLAIPGFVRITAWFNENDSTYFSKMLNEGQSLAVVKYMSDFANAEYREIEKTELKAENNTLKQLEKELDELIKKQDKSAVKISENQREIQRCRDRIATNNGDIQNAAYKISEQKLMVERTMTDKNANKGAKQTLKQLENDRKKIQKASESEGKFIDKLNQEIREEERNIASSKSEQQIKIAEIQKQKETVKKVEQILEGIK